MSSAIKDLVSKLTKLGDRLHLNREQAENTLAGQLIPELLKNPDEKETIMAIIIEVLKVMYHSSRWEDRYGAINGSTLLIRHFYGEKEEDPTLKYFVWNIIRAEKIPVLLVDSEFRVRNQLGPLLKEMISHDQEKGAMHFAKLQETLLDNIEKTFTREPEGGVDASADPKVLKQINVGSDGKTMHDTEGWKSLETSMRILQNIIEAIGTRLYEFQLDRILDCITKGVNHINRFVREISYFVINAIYVSSLHVFDEDTNAEYVQRFTEFCPNLVPIIAQGLGDNWSQVRYAASQAVRSFYLVAKDRTEMRDRYDPLLVPRMCLNRYYVAEGVKIYSNETWVQVHGDQGKEVICRFAAEVATFYISQSQADNHAVREAACHCISELCTKVAQQVSKEPFKPYVAEMLAALLDCFKDMSWPVRDCACIACGSFVSTFPEECEAAFPELSELWFNHLSDNIQSVREHSAESLVVVLKGTEKYKDQLKEKIEAHVVENVMKAKQQGADSHQFAGLENETVFGVAKPKKEHDDGHSDNQLYSCGSLAPKLKRGGGCMDHGFQRAKELWELSDGTVFLLRECSHVDFMQDFVVKQLENLSNLCYLDHFKHSNSLKQNLFKSLTAILTSLGKKKFRAYVELFLDPTFRNARSFDHKDTNMSIAAQEFVLALNKTYGENIFKAIVESHDDRLLKALAEIKEEGSRVQTQDFVYPPADAGRFMRPNQLGIGSGQGAVAGALNSSGVGGPDMMMTKAPWAK